MTIIFGCIYYTTQDSKMHYIIFIELCVGEIKVKSTLLTTKSALTVQ